VALFSIVCAIAAKADEPRDESEHWTPSFALFFDALGQHVEGSVTTGPVLGPPLPDGCAVSTVFGQTGARTPGLCPTSRGKDPASPARPTQILGPNDDGADTSVAPLVGLSLELMTPRLTDEWLRPRFFLHGDGAASFGFERNAAGVEAPKEFALPQGIFINNPQDVRQRLDELAIVGQGTRTRLQVKRAVWSAGTGVAFSFDWLGRRMRIKPSLEYLHQEMDLIGVAHRAIKLEDPFVSVTDLSSFRLISLTQQEQRSYDGIGPGLEIEADAARLGPFMSSVYANGRGYKLLGDLKTELSATNEFGETASWTFEPDSWVWRAGVGIRFRWLPEAD
jgi:hypothetical protein